MVSEKYKYVYKSRCHFDMIPRKMKNYIPIEGYRFLSTFNFMYTYITHRVICFLYDQGLQISFSKSTGRTSLVARWLRTRLPMQGTRVWALVREDPTCRGATKPMCHNYWACALEPVSHNYWARVPQLLKPAYHNYWSPHAWSPCSATREAAAMRSTCATKSSPRSPQLEKSPRAGTKSQCSQK